MTVKANDNKPPQQSAVQAWKCEKCQSVSMLLVDTSEGIQVLCGTPDCGTKFPQLQVKMVDPPGEG